MPHDETFGSTHFFKPVKDFVKRMNGYHPQVNLETCPIANVKSLLRDAIYKELNIQWTHYDGSGVCYTIHPTWKPLRWQREMKSKLTCSWYHSIAVGRGRFKSLLFKHGKTNSRACRFCDIEDEIEDHIIFCCPVLSEQRKTLQTACKNLDVEFNLKNLFTNPKLQRKVESFLYDTFSSYINDKKFFF